MSNQCKFAVGYDVVYNDIINAECVIFYPYTHFEKH